MLHLKQNIISLNGEMNTIIEVREGRFVAPEIDGRHRSMRSLSLMLSGVRHVRRLNGSVRLVSFEAMGWRELESRPRFIAIPGMKEAVAEALPLNALPVGLKFDGAMPDMGLLQFTEYDRSRASFGATFYVPIKGATLEKVAVRREEKRAEFEAGLKRVA